jgi:hypothetical protein
MRNARAELEARRSKAIELAVATFDALVDERGDSGKIWASMLKEAIKRRKPDFSESYYGFRAFGNLLEEAQGRGLLEIGRDEKSGTYVFRRNGIAARVLSSAEAATEPVEVATLEPSSPGAVAAEASNPATARRKGEGRRKAADKGVKRVREVKEVREVSEDAAPAESLNSFESVEQAREAAFFGDVPLPEAVAIRGGAVAIESPVSEDVGEGLAAAEVTLAAEVPLAAATGSEPEAPAAKKPASRSRRPRKPKAPTETA